MVTHYAKIKLKKKIKIRCENINTTYRMIRIRLEVGRRRTYKFISSTSIRKTVSGSYCWHVVFSGIHSVKVSIIDSIHHCFDGWFRQFSHRIAAFDGYDKRCLEQIIHFESNGREICYKQAFQSPRMLFLLSLFISTFVCVF